MKYEFPKDFIWGTATSSHQIEGNNSNNDWWYFENVKIGKNNYPKEKSLDACDSYNRYEDDLDLCVKLNTSAYRFSIEWSRIEPVKGEFDNKAIEHYRNVLLACKKRKLKTFVTLHHFTSPIWLLNEGLFEKSKNIEYFVRYAQKIVTELGDLIDTLVTFNEPQVYANLGYIAGIWTPFNFNPIKRVLVQKNMMTAHIKSYKAIKKIKPDLQVGIVDSIAWFMPSSFIIDKIIAKICYYMHVDILLNPLINAKTVDFIGLNHYRTLNVDFFRVHEIQDNISDQKWRIYPKGLEHVLLDLKRYNLPVYITENGLADKTDNKRTEFIKGMLISVNNAIKLGVNVKGYFHWSLLDNFEWADGYWPKFGLVEIDRENNLKRTPKKSFYEYAKICKENGFTD